MLKKIVILGPESTGKSVLCSRLAVHYSTGWVKEYAREYLLANGREYSYADLSRIAEGQLLEEEKLAKEYAGHDFIFIDTDMYVMKVWSEFVFNNCDLRILNEIVNREYHLYLLTATDLPWVADELREYPDPEQREKLFMYYYDAMQNQPVPFRVISGIDEDRFKSAVAAIDGLFK